MKIIYWNCRGFGNTDTRLVLKKVCLLHKPDFVFLAEPWISVDDVPVSFWNQLRLKPFVSNNRFNQLPHLWGLCNEQVSPTVIANSPQQISVSTIIDGQTIFLCTVYASTTYLNRRSLWTDITNAQVSNPGPWCVFGDFNSVLGSHEVRGSSLPLKVACDEFKAFSDLNKLNHINTSGAKFTWSNGRRGAVKFNHS